MSDTTAIFRRILDFKEVLKYSLQQEIIDKGNNKLNKEELLEACNGVKNIVDEKFNVMITSLQSIEKNVDKNKKPRRKSAK